MQAHTQLEVLKHQGKHVQLAIYFYYEGLRSWYGSLLYYFLLILLVLCDIIIITKVWPPGSRG